MDATLQTATRTYLPAHPTDLKATLSLLRHGRGDRTIKFGSDGVWRATRTPDGAAVQHLYQDANGIHMRAWGSGADWLADRLPVLVGANDTTDDFPDVLPAMTQLLRQFSGVRIPCSQAVWESLLPAVLEQKVTGVEARRSFAALLRSLGEPAPCPPGAPPLTFPLDPVKVAGTPSHVFHAANVERKRSDPIRRCASYATRLEECATMPPGTARERLKLLPGVGEWTAAEVAIRALGDADAVSVGDYHLKNLVAWNLAGRARGTDEEMLELLEPFRPHRGRAVLLLQLGGSAAPRYGPRLTIQQRW
jgi:3-methyladenine DNA glycosylase/8-oxoguanine DNA glycosylase